MEPRDEARSCRTAARLLFIPASLAIVIVLAVAVPVLAQGESAIHGVVKARAEGSSLAGADVAVLGDDSSAALTLTTAADGRFAFPRLVPGDYMLTISRAGFQDQRFRVSLKPREVRNLDVTLALRPLEESVQVTAAARPSVFSPGSTHLTAERLADLPLAQRTNLPDAIIAAAPGMIRGHDDFVHIRGHEVALNPSINGVQFWENAHAVFSPGLGVDYIESMNVMTGGYAAEYGNRFGGILDVVTKSGFTVKNRGSVTFGTGSAGRHNAGLEFGGHTDRTGYYVNLSGFTSDRFLSPPSPRSIHNSGRGLRSFGQLDFQATNNDYVKVVMTGDGVNADLPKEERDEVLRPQFNHVQRSRSQSLIVSWDHVHSASTLMRTAFYQKWSSVHQRPESIDPYGAVTDAERTLRTFGVKSDATRVHGRHAVKGGIDLVLLRPREDLYYLSQPWITFTHLPDVNEPHVHLRGPNRGAGVDRPVVFGDSETGGQASAFLQDSIQLTPNLTVDLGVRFDRYSLAISESHLSPRVNAAYRLPAGTVLFGSYNHFYVPPPIENVLASSAGLTSLVSEIGRTLPPVRAIKENQFELGVTQPIASVMTVGVTGYYRLSDDPPHTTLFPDSRFYTYATFDKGRAYGVEFKADVPRIANLGLSGFLNYALGRVWFYNPIVAGFTTETAHLTASNRFLAPMDQTHTLTSGLTYHNSRTRLWSTVAFEYGSGTPGGHGGGDHAHDSADAHEHVSGPGLCGTRCPSHVTQNVSIGWTAMPNGRLSFQVNVENLSNEVYLLSKESTMVQGQYSRPRLFSGSVKVGF
jgi:outer membrane receptor protein involved in Fe transport